jgi:hypothetical protein
MVCSSHCRCRRREVSRFFESRAVRRKLGELGFLPQQIEMFGG